MITNKVYNEDCLEALKRVPDNSVDCIITLLPTALASMIDIGVAGENRNTILIIAAVMATLAILRLCVYYI